MKEIFGGLLEFEDQSKLTEFTENLDMKTSIKVLEASVEYVIKNGGYSLDEAYCIYMCIQRLKTIEKVI